MAQQINSNFKISRIYSKYFKEKHIIYMHGYDNSGKYMTKRAEFKNYFYFSTEGNDLEIFDDIGHNVEIRNSAITYKNKPVVKIVCNNKDIITALESECSDSIYESDVSPELKYILDNNMQWSKYRHILFLDIETSYDKNDPTANTPDKAEMPITAITFYSSKDKEFFVFSWHPTKTKNVVDSVIKKKNNISFIFSKNEENMINGALKFIQKSNSDIITGWWSEQYDIPYIINRCKLLSIDYTILSPIKRVNIYKKQNFWKTYITGVDHIDMLDVIKELGYNLSNYKLATVASEVLHTKSKNADDLKLTETTWKDWLNNYKGFLKYAIRDVELLVKINDVLKPFDLYVIIQQLANLEALRLIFNKSMIVDNYLLTTYHNKYVFPFRQTKEKISYKAALVIQPENGGLHDNVMVSDYTSLYPTSIMAFNISPETYITSEVELAKRGISCDKFIQFLKNKNIKYIDTGYNEDLIGKRYFYKDHSEKIGLLPKALKKIFLDRMNIKEKMKLETNEQIKQNLNSYQKALKLILNSAYGAMGFNYFRLYKPEIADTITFFARKAFLFAKKEISKSYEVLYGDTDSIMFKLNTSSIEEGKKFLELFNNITIKKFVESYTPIKKGYMFMNLKYEKTLTKFFIGNKKKRYYGLDSETGDPYIKGMSVIRKDAPIFIKDILKKLIELAFFNKLTVEKLIEVRASLENLSYDKIGIPKSFTKKFSEYTKMMPQHVKGAKWANEKLNTNITYIDNPLLFYIVSKCEDDIKPAKRCSAICLLQEDLKLIDIKQDLFELDYETFFSKQIIDQLDEFSLIDNVYSVIVEYKQKNIDFYKKAISLKHKKLNV